MAALLVVPTTVGAFTLWGGESAVGVLAGGAIALVNFWLLARLVVKTTTGEDMEAGALIGNLFLKLGLLGLSVGIALLVFEVDGIGFVLGVSVIFVSVIVVTVAEWVV